MGRRRWVYYGTEAVEVSEDYIAPPRTVADSILWNDRAYQDMNDPRFASRTQHRQYMKDRGLTTMDEYMSGTWRKDEERRIAYRKTGLDPTRKNDIVEAIHKIKR